MNDFLLFMSAPFVACLALLGIHVYLGLQVLQRGVIFVDLALAQVAALGSVLAFLAEHEPGTPAMYLFSLGATLVGAAIFSLTRMRGTEIPQEAIIGIVYAVAAAAGVLALDRAPHGAEHFKTLLVGVLLWVSWADVGRAAAICAGVGLFHWIFRRRFLALSRAEENFENGRVRLWDFLFYASLGLVITSAVQIAGVLLVFSFLIVPAVCAVLFAQGLRARLLIGWSVGFAVSAIGCSVSYLGDQPTGAMVVCTFGVALLLLYALRILFNFGIGPKAFK